MGLESCEPETLGKDQIYMRNIFNHLNDYIYSSYKSQYCRDVRKVLCKRCDLSLAVKDVANILKVEVVGVCGGSVGCIQIPLLYIRRNT